MVESLPTGFLLQAERVLSKAEFQEIWGLYNTLEGRNFFDDFRFAKNVERFYRLVAKVTSERVSEPTISHQVLPRARSPKKKNEALQPGLKPGTWVNVGGGERCVPYEMVKVSIWGRDHVLGKLEGVQFERKALGRENYDENSKKRILVFKVRKGEQTFLVVARQAPQHREHTLPVDTGFFLARVDSTDPNGMSVSEDDMTKQRYNLDTQRGFSVEPNLYEFYQDTEHPYGLRSRIRDKNLTVETEPLAKDLQGAEVLEVYSNQDPFGNTIMTDPHLLLKSS